MWLLIAFLLRIPCINGALIHAHQTLSSIYASRRICSLGCWMGTQVLLLIFSKKSLWPIWSLDIFNTLEKRWTGDIHFTEDSILCKSKYEAFCWLEPIWLTCIESVCEFSLGCKAQPPSTHLTQYFINHTSTLPLGWLWQTEPSPRSQVSCLAVHIFQGKMHKRTGQTKTGILQLSPV